jgi:hypothetical protein
MDFFLLDPQGPPSWAGLSPFPLPFILLSPLDVSKGFMFPSWGMPRSTSTLPHQGVRMFPTPSPSGVPRRGIRPPFPAKNVLYGSGLQLVCSAHSFHPYNPVSLYPSYWLIPHYGEDLVPRERITSTYVRVSNMKVVHICPIPLITARFQLKIVTTRSSN